MATNIKKITVGLAILLIIGVVSGIQSRRKFWGTSDESLTGTTSMGSQCARDVIRTTYRFWIIVDVSNSTILVNCETGLDL